MVYKKINSNLKNDLFKSKDVEYSLIKSKKNATIYKLSSDYLKNKKIQLKLNQPIKIQIHNPLTGQTQIDDAIVLSTNVKECSKILNSKDNLNCSSIELTENNLINNSSIVSKNNSINTSSSTNNSSTESSNKLNSSSTKSTNKSQNLSKTKTSTKSTNESLNLSKTNSSTKSTNESLNLSKTKAITIPNCSPNPSKEQSTISSSTDEIMNKENQNLNIESNLQVNYQIKSQLITNYSKTNHSQISTSNFLDLKFEKRFEIVKLLIRNSNQLQMNNQINTDDKNDLLIANNLLIKNLLNTSNDYNENINDNQVIRNDVNLLKEQFKNLANKTEQSRLELNRKLLEIRTELNSRSEIEFEFVIDDVKNFLKLSNVNKSSNVFYCRNMPFVLGVTIMEKFFDNKPEIMMEFFLKCKEDVTNRWSFKSCFIITLFSNLPYKNRIINVPNIEFSSLKRLAVSNYFIKLSELIDPLNNYIQNNQLVIGLKLKCEKKIIH